MSWFRVGDTAATDPRILALEDPRDPLLGTLCFGFLVKLGTQSANHFTDYVIHPGFLTIAGGPAAPKLLKRCIAAGLITSLGGRGANQRWKLIDTAPELFHIRLKDEVAWEKQQKADTRNPALKAPVLLRDGDACRWCGIPVQPMDTMSRRGRSFDHLRPGQPARGREDLVVACKGCNGDRGKDRLEHDDETADEYAARWAPRLRPAPRQLFFVRSTADWLTSQGHTIPTGSVIADRAAPARNTPTPSEPVATHPANAGVAATDPEPAPGVLHPASQAGVANPGAGGATHPAPAGVAAPPTHDRSPVDGQDAPAATHPASQARVAAAESRHDHRSATNRSGSGRVGLGSGLVGSGGSPPPRASPAHERSSPSTTEPRRTRRGRRRTSSGRQQ